MSMRTKTLFASVNLIGDTIVQTPAIRLYRMQHPDEEIHWVMQDDPARSLFEAMIESGICDHVFFDSNWDRIRSLDYDGYHKRVLMDVQAAFRIGQRTGLHIAQAFGRLIQASVDSRHILPSVPVCQQVFEAIGVPPRCLVISPRSSSNAPVNNFAGSKNLPWTAWPKIIDRFIQNDRIENYVLLLRDHDPPPEVPLCVLRMSLRDAVAYIAKACAGGGLYCGVDNGITHIAAGLGVPTYCVYPSGLAPSWVGYSEFSHYRMARTNPWEGNVDQIWAAWNS